MSVVIHIIICKFSAYNLYFFQVTDSTGHVLYKKDEAVKGKFAFTTDDYDMYEICFESEGNVPRDEESIPPEVRCTTAC